MTFRLSPLTRRRWRSFKANRRGYCSLWIIGSLIFVSLFAEMIANDAPLILRHKGEYYFPAFVVYPESTFGGSFGTEAEYREPEVQQLLAE